MSPAGFTISTDLPSNIQTDVLANLTFDSELFHSVATDVSDAIRVVADTGASTSCSGDERDFEPGSLRRLPEPRMVGGIAGSLTAEYEGMLCWETVDDHSNIITFRTKGLLVKGLPCRLFSPQSFLCDSQRLDDHFKVFGNRSEWHMCGRKLLTLEYDSSFLPRMTMFRAGTALKSLEALNAGVISETNQNLSPWQRIWLLWHHRLGHPGFALVRALGVGGCLDMAGLSLSQVDRNCPPKCVACQYGKQASRPS